MLKDIKFCSCSNLDTDGEEENQCMFFQFTERALKMLSEGLLKQISDTDKDGNPTTGIYAGVDEDGNEKYVKIHKMKDNLWRIPTKYIDPFIRLLFKYLPAYYVSPEERQKHKCHPLSNERLE